MANEKIKLPKIDRLLNPDLVARYGHDRVVQHARRLVDAARRSALDGHPIPEEDIITALPRALDDGLRPLINGTGVLLHTNLGRAPWSPSAIDGAMAATGYCPVEFDLELGGRGHRGAPAEDRIRALTGAPAALIVNNCAGAVLLMLSALAKDKRVIVSRGELVEIGGGFRVPDVMAASGAQLHEVGTTNRTHLKDFRGALGPDVAGVLRVHHSNFKQVGFVAQPSLRDLAQLDVPLMVDLGSGQLSYADAEPSVAEALSAGAAVICMSGDKLLGGPQAGIVIGQADPIEAMRSHPLYRALRPDKAILGALQGTVDDWLTGTPAPLTMMREAKLEILRGAVVKWCGAISHRIQAEVIESEATIGGGSLPGQSIPSVALGLGGDKLKVLRQALLRGTPPVVCRHHEGRLLFDARTIVPLGLDSAFLSALESALDALDP